MKESFSFEKTGEEVPKSKEALFSREKIVIDAENMWEAQEIAVSGIRETFRKRIETRYGERGEYPLIFHVWDHSADVIRAAVGSAEAVKKIEDELVREGIISNEERLIYVKKEGDASSRPDDRMLLEMEGASHDALQNSFHKEGKMLDRWRGAEDQDIKGLQESHPEANITAGNEKASELELLAEMERYYFPDETPVFPASDPGFRKEVHAGFAATYPLVDVAPLPNGTPALRIDQQHLTPHSPFTALLLANADLRGPLREENAFPFISNGLKEWAELELERHYKKIKQGAEAKDQTVIAASLLGWGGGQGGVGDWQKVLFFRKNEENRALNRKDAIEQAQQEIAAIRKENPPDAEEKIHAREKRIENVRIHAERVKAGLNEYYEIPSGRFDANTQSAREYYKGLEDQYQSLRRESDSEKFGRLVEEVEKVIRWKHEAKTA